MEDKKPIEIRLRVNDVSIDQDRHVHKIICVLTFVWDVEGDRSEYAFAIEKGAKNEVTIPVTY